MNYFGIYNSGKQFLLNPGEWYDIDRVKKASSGEILYLKKLLFYKKEKKFQLGQPFLGKGEIGIGASVIQNIKGKKIRVLKTRPKKNYTRTKGHRSSYTRIQLESLS
jgi:large subunit ribosomal protein L21